MISERTKSILLLTSYFSPESDSRNKPLSIKEWNRLVIWLQDHSLSPEDLLTMPPEDLIGNWRDKAITTSRLNALLERKTALAIALEKWTQAGIWIINRGDVDYPKSIKNKLKDLSPPIFFGIGNKKLLNKPYIGIVGARDASDEELKQTSMLGAKISNLGYGVVSGGARGVDESAMLGALEIGGNCIGVLADSLINRSTSSKYRKYIVNKELTLISPFNPEAGFNAGNAMARNKFIYVLSEATIVVKSNKKGGTWEGAKENLKNDWVPLWVLKSTDNTSGNAAIVEMGARWLDDLSNLNIEVLTSPDSAKINQPIDLFSMPIDEANEVTDSEAVETRAREDDGHRDSETREDHVEVKDLSLFEFFVLKLAHKFPDTYAEKDSIMTALDITTRQLDEWLKLGVERGLIERKTRPVRYKAKEYIDRFN